MWKILCECGSKARSDIHFKYETSAFQEDKSGVLTRDLYHNDHHKFCAGQKLSL